MVEKKAIGQYKNIEKIIYMAVVSLLNFTAMTSVGGSFSYLSQDNGYPNLGNISLLINNVSAAICTFIAPTVINRLKYNQLFSLSCLTVMFFVTQGILMSSCPIQEKASLFYCADSIVYSVTIVGSLIFGFGSPLYSVGSALYISENTNLHNKGLFFGIFFSILQLSILSGQVYSLLIIDAYGERNFFIITSFITGISTVLFFFVKDPAPQLPGEELDDEETRLLKEFNKLKPMQQVHEVFQTAGRPQVIPLLAYFLQAGFIPGIEAGVLGNLIDTSTYADEIRNSHLDEQQMTKELSAIVMKCGIALGICEFLGGQAMVFFGDKFDKRNFGRFNNQTYQIAIFISLIAFGTGNYYVCFPMACVWGFTDCVGTSLNNALVSERFGDDVKVFAVYALFNNIGTALSMAISLFYFEQPQVYFGIVMLLQILANLSLSYMKTKQDVDKDYAEIQVKNQNFNEKSGTVNY